VIGRESIKCSWRGFHVGRMDDEQLNVRVYKGNREKSPMLREVAYVW